MSKKNKKVEEVKEVVEEVETEVVETEQVEQQAAETEEVKTELAEVEKKTEDEVEVVEKTKKFDPFHKIKENPKKALATAVKGIAIFGAGVLAGKTLFGGNDTVQPDTIEDAEFKEVVDEDVDVNTSEIED